MFFRPTPPLRNIRTRKIYLEGPTGNSYELYVNNQNQLQISYNNKPISTISPNGNIQPISTDIQLDGETMTVDSNVNIISTSDLSKVILGDEAFTSNTEITINNEGPNSTLITVPDSNDGFTSQSLFNLAPFRFKTIRCPPDTSIKFTPIRVIAENYWTISDQSVNSVSISVDPISQQITSDLIEKFRMSRNFSTGEALFLYIKSSDKNLYLKIGTKKASIDENGFYNLSQEIQITNTGEVQNFTNTVTYPGGGIGIATMFIDGSLENNIAYYESSLDLQSWDEYTPYNNVSDFVVDARFRLELLSGNPAIFYYSANAIRAIYFTISFDPLIKTTGSSVDISIANPRFSVRIVDDVIVLASLTNAGVLVQLANSSNNYEFTDGNIIPIGGSIEDAVELSKITNSDIKVILTDSVTKEKKTADLSIAYPNVTSNDIIIEPIDEGVIENIESQPTQIVTTFEFSQTGKTIDNYDLVQSLLPNDETEPIIHVIESDPLVNIDETPVYSNIDDIFITKNPLPEVDPSPSLIEYVQQQPNTGVFVYPSEGANLKYTITKLTGILFP